MLSFNHVVLMGHLTSDPELKMLPSNTPVANFMIAINRKWESRDGEPKEETVFAPCEIYGKQADLMGKRLRKGDPILIEGRLKLDQWVAKTGEKRSKLSVVATGFQFLTKNEDRPSSELSWGKQSKPGMVQESSKEPHKPLEEEQIPF